MVELNYDDGESVGSDDKPVKPLQSRNVNRRFTTTSVDTKTKPRSTGRLTGLRPPLKPSKFLADKEEDKLPTSADIDAWSDAKVKSYFTEERAPHRLKALKDKNSVVEMRAYLKGMFAETPREGFNVATASDEQIYKHFGSHVKPDLVRALHGYKFNTNKD